MKKVGLTIFLCGFAIFGYLQTTQNPQIEAGKKVYIKNCLACHMPNGDGVPGLNPPLTKSDWVSGDKKRLINVILKGLDEPIEVNGEEYENPMPPLNTLTDQEIADVLTYIRASFGNKATAVKPAEVKALRVK